MLYLRNIWFAAIMCLSKILHLKSVSTLKIAIRKTQQFYSKYRTKTNLQFSGKIFFNQKSI